MLFRDSIGPVQEALAIVWEGAEHVFRRDASTYGVTGMERVPLSSSSPLARVYAGAARAMALTRTPLFQRRSAGAITVNLALLSPPAVILSGDVRTDTPELHASTSVPCWQPSIPQYAPLFGSPEVAGARGPEGPRLRVWSAASNQVGRRAQLGGGAVGEHSCALSASLARALRSPGAARLRCRARRVADCRASRRSIRGR